MESIVNLLNKRFDIVFLESSDKEFYLNLYHYFDYIENTHELKSIFDQSGRDYSVKLKEIRLKNATSQINTETAKAQLRKVELFNLHALGCGIYLRIYLAISEYRKTDEVDDLQDPVIILLFYGIDYAKKMKRWDKEYINLYNSWFGGKRIMYEAELKQFHLLMLEELAKQKPIVITPEITTTKIPLYLNLTTGDFIFHNTRGTFSPATQEFKILSTLLYSKDYTATHFDLYNVIHPNTQRIMGKTHRDRLSLIIRNIKKKLNIIPTTKESNSDIFKSIPKVAYCLIFKDSSVIAE